MLIINKKKQADGDEIVSKEGSDVSAARYESIR